MISRIYLCEKCGKPPYVVTYPGKVIPPEVEVCPECGAMMRRLPQIGIEEGD